METKLGDSFFSEHLTVLNGGLPGQKPVRLPIGRKVADIQAAGGRLECMHRFFLTEESDKMSRRIPVFGAFEKFIEPGSGRWAQEVQRRTDPRGGRVLRFFGYFQDPVVLPKRKHGGSPEFFRIGFRKGENMVMRAFEKTTPKRFQGKTENIVAG